MVLRVSNIIKEYQDILREKPYVPKTYFQRDSMGFSGDANELFLTLFSDCAIGLQFFKDVELIRSNVQCNSCGCDMTSYTHHSDNSYHFYVRISFGLCFL